MGIVRRVDGSDAFAAVQERSELKATVRDTWKAVLRRETVESGDDFFELGGDSLLAAVMVGVLSDIVGCEVSIEDLYLSPTLDAFSERVLTRKT